MILNNFSCHGNHLLPSKNADSISFFFIMAKGMIEKGSLSSLLYLQFALLSKPPTYHHHWGGRTNVQFRNTKKVSEVHSCMVRQNLPLGGITCLGSVVAVCRSQQPTKRWMHSIIIWERLTTTTIHGCSLEDAFCCCETFSTYILYQRLVGAAALMCYCVGLSQTGL